MDTHIKCNIDIYICLCLLDFTFLVSDDNECLSNPCQNGGTCIDLYNYYSCQCVGRFIGNNCQIGSTYTYFSIKEQPNLF